MADIQPDTADSVKASSIGFFLRTKRIALAASRLPHLELHALCEPFMMSISKRPDLTKIFMEAKVAPATSGASVSRAGITGNAVGLIMLQRKMDEKC